MRANPGELEVWRNVLVLESLLDFLLEHYEFIFHFGVDVSLVVRGPESPKSVANNVSESGLLLAKYVLSKLSQNVLPLQQLLPYFLFLPHGPVVHVSLRLLHGVGDRRHGHLGVANWILKNQLLDANAPFLVALILTSLLVVLAVSIHGWLLRPSQVVDLLVSHLGHSSRWLPVLGSLALAGRHCLLLGGLIHLALELDRVRQRASLRPLLTLGILLVDLLQVDLVMLVLVLAGSLRLPVSPRSLLQLVPALS